MPTACSTWHCCSARVDGSVINPKTILGEWVTALQSCPDLVDALGGDGDNIRAFMEGLATDNNLRLAILQMPPGSILVAWNGTTPRRLTGGSLHFAHRFSIYLRAPEQNSTATYADLFWLLVSAIPTGAPSWASLLHVQIDPDCYPMDMDLPSAQRNTVVVSADGRPSITRGASNAGRARQSRRGIRATWKRFL